MNQPANNLLKKYFFKGLLFYFFLFFSSVFSQNSETTLKKYSHAAFLKMIQNEKSDLFVLRDAFIYFDAKTDAAFFYKSIGDSLEFKSSDSIVINKEIELDNVHFEQRKEATSLALHNLIFKQAVSIYSVTSIYFYNCVFDKKLTVESSRSQQNIVYKLAGKYPYYKNGITLVNCVFNTNPTIDFGDINNYSPIDIFINTSNFNDTKPNNQISFTGVNISSLSIRDNHFKGKGFVNITADKSTLTDVSYNDFGNYNLNISQAGINSSSQNFFEENNIHNTVIFSVDAFSQNDVYRWNQWKNKIISRAGYDVYLSALMNKNNALVNKNYLELFYNDSLLKSYKKSAQFQLEHAYKYEKRLLGNFYNFYKSQYDTDYSNTVYVSIKNLETKRLAYLYKQKPTFKTYFTWKINQFLRVFSAYGTEPSKSIIISIYVILFFACVYVFFPNSWDTMSKNRLMRRIHFYTKYFRIHEGMKEIYQEDKKESLMTFTEFKRYMDESKKEVPVYFIWLAKPLYYFSSTNYNIISRFLDKTDVLKGKWIDLPTGKKISTSIFIGLWIFILLIFDLFLKFLNALTLSLNTFTTLGFGEIPTKGLPRYLCVIQGFIGWFMLSIFSVSLISQLLN